MIVILNFKVGFLSSKSYSWDMRYYQFWTVFEKAFNLVSGNEKNWSREAHILGDISFARRGRGSN